MNFEFVTTRSLPPLVDGKVHGYLKLKIDEIVWTKRNPGNVTVLVSWWGELDSAQLRPSDLKNIEVRSEKDNVETYALRTNIELFEEYLRNSETVELIVISEKFHQIVGTSRITELLEILSGKSYFHIFPILNSNYLKIGEIHISMKLTTAQKSHKTPRKFVEHKKQKSELNKIESDELISPRLKFLDSDRQSYIKNYLDCQTIMPLSTRNLQNDDIYKSVLKEKRYNIDSGKSKFNPDLTDRLVAQVVARAQKLRGELLNEEDYLGFSESSTSDSFRYNESLEKEEVLHKYFLGKNMSRRSEKKALETLRSDSPTPSLIDFATETIRSCNDKNYVNENRPYKKNQKENDIDELKEEKLESNRLIIQQKEASPIDFVDSLRISVESLTLSSAGYRRVKSSCLPRCEGAPVSVTYFVQYDAMFTNNKSFIRKMNNESKPVKMTSKRQVDQVIFFNHEAVYDLPKNYLFMDMPLKFRISNRHLNQRAASELGIGSVHISDAARSKTLSSVQRLAIIKKGIKIGELKVTIELGCDKIHFGKSFVEAVTSAKENIPVLELSSNSSITSPPRFKSATGTEGNKSNNRGHSAPEKKENYSSGYESNNPRNFRDLNDKNRMSDGRVFKIDIPKCMEEKILLHGLIYIAEGKDLPSITTYLICRAFWREDRALSQVCSDTINPFYDFHQLVPLIHGPELLERTKDNCIITEVYSKNPTGEDILIGIAKLSVHQLYVAFRDPLILPHLLKSKYPVISVDGWVQIIDPVTGRLCGQILGLVALGTADQIALLEMTRGLRNSSVTPRTTSTCTRIPMDLPVREIPQDKKETNTVTQQCQTEISTVFELKSQKKDVDLLACASDSNVLHAIVDRLVQALSVPKTISDQGAQTEFEISSKDEIQSEKTRIIEPLILRESNSNSFYGDSCNNDSPRENLNMPREIYRSVGVGAEFSEPINQQNSNSASQNIQNDNITAEKSIQSESTKDSSPPGKENKDENTTTGPGKKIFDYEELNPEESENDEIAFRAVVEIECALHLPQVYNIEKAVDPCTYVTFQKVRNKSTSRIGSYMMTDICPYTCSPKYEWKCDTKLSTDLLVNEDKRLIMKVWRLIDPEKSMVINLDKDIVIGFSAIDLHLLTTGFPVVSGWFHIMDFAGKCNGQLQASVTPLDDISAFTKNSENSPSNIENPDFANHSENVEEVVAPPENQVEELPSFTMGFDLENASMSFLSHSLNQKLSELDEIKKRLQSRLQDVTSTAFDDEFDKDFEPPENDFDHKVADDNENESNNQSWLAQISENTVIQKTNIITNGNHCLINENENKMPSSQQIPKDNNLTDTGYSSSSKNSGSQPLSSRNHRHHQNDQENHIRSIEGDDENDFSIDSRTNITRKSNGHSNVENENNISTRSQNIPKLDVQSPNHQISEVEYPIRGTRMHISHLLDKLSSELTAAPPPIANMPMKRNIMDLISSLRRDNNNFSNDVKCNREANVRTVPTQTDGNFLDFPSSNNSIIEPVTNPEDEIPAKAQRRDKISTVIREEMIAEDQNNTSEFDELSTHLIASNVRHMDVDNILNPLLYPHILHDTSESTGAEINPSSPSVTPEVDGIERLDSRYSESFTTSINKSMCRLRNLVEVDQLRETNSQLLNPDNTEIFRATTSGVVDGNFDVTVIQKPCNNNLTENISTESTTTVSFDNTIQTGTEIDDNSSLNSSETSVSNVSRQAPEGGNPIEDPSKISTTKRKEQSGDSSSSTS